MSEKKYGPNTAEVEAYLALLPKLTDEQWAAACAAAQDGRWATAVHAARAVARDAAQIAAWVAASYAARYIPWVAAWTAVALVTRDLITPEHFDTLTAPMRAAGIGFDALLPEAIS